MIKPAEIREKAARKYRSVLQSWIRGEAEALFPMAIQSNRDVGKNAGEAARAVDLLRAGSKAVCGHGYEIEWEERRSRQFGKNQFPKKIVIPSPNDFFKLIGKYPEFTRFSVRVSQLRETFPELETWLESNVIRVVKFEPDWEGLIEVLDYFREHPSPGVFARELPLAVDSKFIENHHAELRPLLEAILPEGAIATDEMEFDRRFGLRPFEAMIRMRFLDPDLQRLTSIEQSEIGLPVDQLCEVDWPIRRVIIVENARCLLTLPVFPGTGTLGLFGHGYRVSNFRRLDWMAGCEIIYWGDIDVQGFEILSDLRHIWPQTRSVLMDLDVVEKIGDRLSGNGKLSRRRVAPVLETCERDAWKWCRDNNRRIEQERIPMDLLNTVF